MWAILAAVLPPMVVVSIAGAQGLPPGSAATPATSGSSDVTSTGFQLFDKKDLKEKNATELVFSGGGIQSGGNTRVLALTTLERFRLRRGDEQVKAVFAANYGQSASSGEEMRVTAENLQALARYDHYLGRWILFFALQARHDRFQGLDARFQIDPGVGYFFVDEKTESLWLEAGYDFRYDIRRDDALTVLDAKGAPVIVDGQPQRLDKTATVHSTRFFLGFEAKLNGAVSLTSGLEYLQSVTDDSVYRINADLSLTSKVSKRFAVSLTLSERYEHTPLPGKLPLDTTEAASLVYSLF